MIILNPYKKYLLIVTCILSLVSFIAHAQASGLRFRQHIVLAPQCLVENLGTRYDLLASNKELFLIATDKQGITQLNLIKKSQKKPCGGFVDVTRAWQKYHALNTTQAIINNSEQFLAKYTKFNKSPFSAKNEIYKIRYKSQVNQLLKQINPHFLWDSLPILSNFPDRSSETASGVDAAYWIKSQIDMMTKESGRQDITTYMLETKRKDADGYPIDLKQPSIIIKIGSSSEPGVVVGAHFDTLRKYDLESSKKICSELTEPTLKRICEDSLSSNKPGADDDASGSSIILEVTRALLNSGMQFKKPIYLVWYAAEEVGLVGSQRVVEDFQKRNIPISVVMQLDQVGYAYQNDPTMWLVTNYVNANLTTYLAELIKEYVKQPIKYTTCHYACSDNASWDQQGIPVAFPFESEMAFGRGNLYVHTAQDTIEKLSLAHMTDYAKLAIAFAVELAEPVTR